MNCGIVASWNELLADFPAGCRDIYFTEEYVGLYATETEQAAAFYYREDKQLFLMPFLRRSFVAHNEKFYDFESAYGYGGPITNSKDRQFHNRAMAAFVDVCRREGYVAGFVRFHPLLDNDLLSNESIEIIPDRNTVAIDLRPSLDDIWMTQIHTKNRNVIKKAIGSGLTFEADYAFDRLSDFCRLYNATMEKLGAEEFYYFSPEYFETFKQRIPNSFIGVVKHGDKVLAAAIFMWEGPWGHYHLSGSDKEALKMCPNNLLLWGAAKELKAKGVELFHLGGGTDSSADNSLLGFKKKFSHTLCRFSIGKMIFNRQVLDCLYAEWEKKNPQKSHRYKHFLLKYKY